MVSNLLEQPLLNKTFDNYVDLTLYPHALHLAELKDYQNELPASQLSGLINVIENATDSREVKQFAKHQQTKLENGSGSKSPDMKLFWQKFLDLTETINQEITALWNELKKRHLQELCYDPNEEKTLVEKLYLTALKALVDQTAAHNAYIFALQPKEKKDRR